ncbi:NB-ARC domain-containing protein [Amycolatopsis sp. CA-230715]|uniref:NB-ARC domain-containing protein n=1 Tax=Amycolatopsis sp. CA-230715 TaxID=2745196 RepID=UPI001C01F6EC|nr:NB-ARC domain-containing protein [Amycolatopsis sp. CA-230715]QWF77477.1 Regulatory protein AfsR [Amycolatopsis sp. CA-230715]
MDTANSPGSEFGRELERLVARRALSWRKLSQLVGYTPSWLSKVKNGAPPSPELARRCDEVLEAGGSLVAAAGGQPVGPRPAQLPAATAYFTGRKAELGELDAALAGEDDSCPPVALLSGPPGAGKTALALYWAHTAAARFPGGQLYVDLRGHSPSGEPVTPETALDHLITAVAGRGAAIPATLGERAALYRSLLSGTRTLVLLDNALDAAQVEHLLPGTAGCAVLITSRTDLMCTGVRFGVRRVVLGPLKLDESVELLRRVIGPSRADAEPGAAAVLADECDRLPLALRIAGELVATRRENTVGELVGHLSTHKLDLLSVGETASVRAVMAWSYRGLTPAAASLFRMLGLLAGPDWSLDAAAALTGFARERVRDLVDVLFEAHLIERADGDHYRMHGLLRLYAAERARHEERPDAIAAAITRLTRWYLATTLAASARIAPYRRKWMAKTDLPAYRSGEAAEFADAATAIRWCDAESRNLESLLRTASAYGLADLVWRIPIALYDYFLFRKPWSVWLATTQLAAEAARRCGNRAAEGWATTSQAIAWYWRNDLDRSETLHTTALAIADEVGDPLGQAWAHYGLACAAVDRAEPTRALGHAEKALRLFTEVMLPEGKASALAVLGTVHRTTGRIDSAFAVTQRALRVCEELRDPHGRGRKLIKLAEIHQQRGKLADAMTYLNVALTIRVAVEDHWGVADVRVRRGDLLLELGDREQAVAEWTRALAYYRETGDPRADSVARKVATPRTGYERSA